MRRLLALALVVLSACTATPDPRTEEGRLIFTTTAQPACATCHRLADVDAVGVVGPDLDQLRPDSARVSRAVSQGVGIMPPQSEMLTPDQIAVVAWYVSQVVGR